MKTKLLKLSGILIFSSLFILSSCDPTQPNPDPEPIPKPVELKAPDSLSLERPSGNIAVLSWAGNGDSYEVNIISENTVIKRTVTETKYTVTYGDDFPEGKYSWKVQAIQGEKVSDWVESELDSTSIFTLYPPTPEGSYVEATFGGKTWRATNIVAWLIRAKDPLDGNVREAIRIWGEGVTGGFPTVAAYIPTDVGTFDLNVMPYYEISYYDKEIFKQQGIELADWYCLAGTGGTLVVTEYDPVNLITSFEVTIQLVHMPTGGSERADLHAKFHKVHLQDKRIYE